MTVFISSWSLGVYGVVGWASPCKGFFYFVFFFFLLIKDVNLSFIQFFFVKLRSTQMLLLFLTELLSEYIFFLILDTTD